MHPNLLSVHNVGIAWMRSDFLNYDGARRTQNEPSSPRRSTPIRQSVRFNIFTTPGQSQHVVVRAPQINWEFLLKVRKSKRVYSHAVTYTGAPDFLR